MRPDPRQLSLFGDDRPARQLNRQRATAVRREEKLRALKELARWWRSKR